VKASLKRWVLRACLIDDRGSLTVVDGEGVPGGGAAAEKALSPQVHRLVLMVLRVFAPADLRQRVGDWRGKRSERKRGLRLFRAL